MAKPKPKSSSKSGEKKVKIHYLKTPQFRNIFVSGAYGGAAKGVGRIYMSIFSDRIPIPQMTVNIVEGGVVKGEDEREKISKDGVIRDVEANLIFDLPTAKALTQWLNHKIQVMETDK